MEKKYKLGCVCGNCHHHFDAEIEFGEDADERGYGEHITIYVGKEAITCPRCGSYKTKKSY